jgi:hypothetical protein
LKSIIKTSTGELRVFVTVIDRGSIIAAAEKLRRTVSGVVGALSYNSGRGTSRLQRSGTPAHRHTGTPARR